MSGAKKFFMAAGSNPENFNINGATFDGTPVNYFQHQSINIPTVSGENIAFNGDGSKFYSIERINSTIYAYDCSTNWDISTATYNGESFYTTPSIGNSPKGLAFDPTGDKMYVLRNAVVYEIPLSTPYDISTTNYNGDNYDFGNSTGDTNIVDFKFKDDGTRIFVVAYTDKRVYTQPLSQAWDITSVQSTLWDLYYAPAHILLERMDIRSDRLWLATNTGTILVWEISNGNWDIRNTSRATAEDINLEPEFEGIYTGFLWKKTSGADDGERFYLATAYNTSSNWQIDVGTNYRTNTYTSPFPTTKFKWFNPADNEVLGAYNQLQMHPSGTSFFLNSYLPTASNFGVTKYNLSTPWEIHTATWDSAADLEILVNDYQVNSCYIRPTDGKKLYCYSSGLDRIYQCSMNPGFDLSTLTKDASYFQAGAGTLITHITSNSNGTRFFLYYENSGRIYQADLSTAWNISTATLGDYLDASFHTNNKRSFKFNNVGNKLFILSRPNYTNYSGTGIYGAWITVYTLTTSWDLTTASHVQSKYLPIVNGDYESIDFSQDGTSVYCLTAQGYIFQVNISE